MVGFSFPLAKELGKDSNDLRLNISKYLQHNITLNSNKWLPIVNVNGLFL